MQVICVREPTCAWSFFVTYLIPWLVYLQSGSVCEGILWSDSRPAEEREERKEGGGERWKEWEGEIKQENSHLTACTKLFSGSQLCEQRLYIPNTFFMSLKLKLSALILTLHRTNWELLFAAKSDKQHKSRWHSQHKVQMFLKQHCSIILYYSAASTVPTLQNSCDLPCGCKNAQRTCHYYLLSGFGTKRNSQAENMMIKATWQDTCRSRQCISLFQESAHIWCI